MSFIYHGIIASEIMIILCCCDLAASIIIENIMFKKYKRHDFFEITLTVINNDSNNENMRDTSQISALLSRL